MRALLGFQLLTFLTLTCGSEAQDASGSELTTVVGQFDERYRVDVVQPFATAVIALNGSYAAALERRRQAVQALGHLDEAIALQTERELVLAGKVVPAGETSIPPSLKALRDTYTISYKKLETERLNKLKIHNRAFADALQTLKLRLTKEGKLGEAKAVEIRLEETNAALTGGGKPSKGDSEGTAKIPAKSRLDPSDYFKGEVFRDLPSAVDKARAFQKPVWLVAYAPIVDAARIPHWRLHYFMQLDETRKLVSENFEQVLLPFGSESIKPFLAADDSTETAMLIILSPAGGVIKKLILNHNGEDALRLTKQFVEQSQQTQ